MRTLWLVVPLALGLTGQRHSSSHGSRSHSSSSSHRSHSTAAGPLEETGPERLGFRGAYFSDYSGIPNLMTQHHVAADLNEAAILALNAGVDSDLPLKFEAGLFEHPYIDPARALSRLDTAAAVALARTAAEKAIVLLKNDGVLPLDANATLKLAVIGPGAEGPSSAAIRGRTRRRSASWPGSRPRPARISRSNTPRA